MVARSDNSPEKSLSGLLPRTGEGIVIDIGTGDGRFVSVAARANPSKFYIGIDASTKPLEKPSMKATRKPSKGGLPNALFVQAAVEDLPEELDGVANEIHVHFPWGSLLRAVATGDKAILGSLRRLAASDCLLEIVIGVDVRRDAAELARLGIPQLSLTYIQDELIPKYGQAGFEAVDHGVLGSADWKSLETSWARKLQGNPNRTVFFFVFRVI